MHCWRVLVLASAIILVSGSPLSVEMKHGERMGIVGVVRFVEGWRSPYF